MRGGARGDLRLLQLAARYFDTASGRAVIPIDVCKSSTAVCTSKGRAPRTAVYISVSLVTFEFDRGNDGGTLVFLLILVKRDFSSLSTRF